LVSSWRVGPVLSDYALGSKKRNQSGTDYVLDERFFDSQNYPKILETTPHLSIDRLHFVIPNGMEFCRHMKLKCFQTA
jgi:hypothetical protein